MQEISQINKKINRSGGGRSAGAGLGMSRGGFSGGISLENPDD